MVCFKHKFFYKTVEHVNFWLSFLSLKSSQNQCKNAILIKAVQDFIYECLFLMTIALSLHSIFKKGTMYAIVDIAGQQLKVAKDQYVYTPKIEGEAGTAVSFDKVLLLDNGSGVEVGSPVLKGVKVSGKILEQVKGDKLIVFKKKRRKGYAVKNGHRQQYTKVQIESIG